MLVRIIIEVNVTPENPMDVMDDVVLRNVAREAVENAVRQVEAEGFAHGMAEFVNIDVWGVTLAGERHGG
jgi:hypothetical protein